MVNFWWKFLLSYLIFHRCGRLFFMLIKMEDFRIIVLRYLHGCVYALNHPSFRRTEMILRSSWKEHLSLGHHPICSSSRISHIAFMKAFACVPTKALLNTTTGLEQTRQRLYWLPPDKHLPGQCWANVEGATLPAATGRCVWDTGGKLCEHLLGLNVPPAPRKHVVRVRQDLQVVMGKVKDRKCPLSLGCKKCLAATTLGSGSDRT